MIGRKHTSDLTVGGVYTTTVLTLFLALLRLVILKSFAVPLCCLLH